MRFGSRTSDDAAEKFNGLVGRSTRRNSCPALEPDRTQPAHGLHRCRPPAHDRHAAEMERVPRVPHRVERRHTILFSNVKNRQEA